MKLGLLKVDYQDFLIRDMEQVYLSQEHILSLYKLISETSYICDCVCLMTCNRVEIYFFTSSFDQSYDFFRTFICQKNQTKAIKFDELFTFCTDFDEIGVHLFRVVSGLNSMVFGENEILAQVKQAYAISQENLSLSPICNKLFQAAIATGKRVRHETQIGQGASSISSIAIEAIRQDCLDYFEKRILLVGAGVMVRRALKKFQALGHPHLFVSNRDSSKLEGLQSEFDFDIVLFEDLDLKLASFDIVVCATSSEKPIITPAMLALKGRKTSFLVDLGVPRNIDADVDNLPRLSRITVSHLQGIAEKNIGYRKKYLSDVNLIINQQYDDFLAWMHWREKKLV